MKTEISDDYSVQLEQCSMSESTENASDTTTIAGEDNARTRPVDEEKEMSSEKSELKRVATAQDWTGPDDPENPFNWPMWKRIFNTAMTGLLAFVVTFGSSVYTPGIKGVIEQFGVSEVVALLPLFSYTLALGFGPVIGAPISETYGRVVVYKFSTPISMLFTLGAGWSRTMPQLVICRFFAGMFGSPVLAVGAGTNADIWPTHLRAVAVCSFLMAPFLGPAFGPAVGGYSAMLETWRWTQWDILFASIVIYAASLFMEESYKKIILKKRAKKLGLPPPPQGLTGKAKLKFILTVTITRPIHMLFFEPIVAFFGIYVAFAFSVLFAFFESFPVIFQGIYHFNIGEAGLVFLAVGFGVLLAGITGITLDRKLYQKHHHHDIAEGKIATAPEYRLYAAMFGSIGLPVGLFWLGWTAREDIHWIVPTLAAIPFAWGNLCIFLSAALYLVDVYGPLAGASAMGANGLARYTMGAVLPLAAVPMFRNLSVGWAMTIFGFISIGMLPIPWILFRYGRNIRAKSHYDTIKA